MTQKAASFNISQVIGEVLGHLSRVGGNIGVGVGISLEVPL